MTVRRYHYARLYRQYRHLAKAIKSRLASLQGPISRSLSQKIRKFRQLHERLRTVLPGHRLRPILAGLAIGLLPGQQVQAQSFNPGVEYPFGVSDDFFFPQPGLADIDNDGDLDLFFGGYYGYSFYGNITFMENVGTAQDPAFGEGISSPFGIDLNYAGNPEFADLDNDGDLDVLIGNYFGYNTVTYYENTGTANAPEFDNAQANPFGISAPYSFFSNIDVADLDNDGDYDLVLNGYYGDFFYFENIGTPEAPAFTNAGDLDLSLGFTYLRSTEFVDLDNDGDLDLFQHDYSFYLYGSGIFYTENTGTPETPTFGLPINEPFGIFVDAFNYGSLTAGDMDSDGDVDLWVGTDFDGLLYFENTSITNAAPASEDTFFEVEENGVYFFSGDDFPIFDPEGDELQEVQITGLPSVGALSFKGLPVTLNQIIPVPNLSGITYTPLPDEFGDNYDSFQFKVSDGFNFSSESYTMTVNVLESQNATPTSEDFGITLVQDGSYTFAAEDFPYADPDGDPLATVRIVTVPTQGSLLLNAVSVFPGQEIEIDALSMLEFIPAPGEFGNPYASFDFRVGDANSFSALDYTVTIEVTQSLSVSKQLPVDSWQLFPNPASETISLSARIGVPVEAAQLVVMNQVGKILWVKEVTLANQRELRERIPMQDYSPGVYWIQFLSDEGVYYEKVILQ